MVLAWLRHICDMRRTAARQSHARLRTTHAKGVKKEHHMSWVKFSLAVVATSVALVIGLAATGTFVVANALANGGPVYGLGQGGPGGPGGHWGNGNGFRGLPPELASLKDVPAGERFAHFKGAQVSLTDKDGKPIAIAATPGVVSAVSASSVSIAGNDGASHTYALNDQTMTHGKTISSGDDVVVVTIDNASTAGAVFSAKPGDWGHN
jgi:hypothetical protein